MFKHVLIAALVVFSLSDFVVEKGVLVLGSTDIQAAIGQFHQILIEFYAPWCGHCQRLAPEYQKAAEQLLASGSKVRLAKVDVTQHESLGQKYNIQGFPTLLYFNNGQSSSYTGGRTAEGILKWLDKQARPASTLISSQDQLDSIIAKNEISLFFFGENAQLFSVYEQVARADNDYSYYHFTDSSFFGTRQPGTIQLFAPFKKEGSRWIRLSSNNVTTQVLTDFVYVSSSPDILPFGDKAIDAIFERAQPGLLILNYETDSKNLFAILENVCPREDFDFICVDARHDNPQTQRVVQWLKLTKDGVSRIILINPESGKVFLYQLPVNDITESLLLEFYDDYKNDRLSPYELPDEEHQHEGHQHEGHEHQGHEGHEHQGHDHSHVQTETTGSEL